MDVSSSDDQFALRQEVATFAAGQNDGQVASSLDVRRIHGGSGYLTEFDIERDPHDAVGRTLCAGTSDIQRTLVTRLLGR